jgi:hypothetical protein
MNNEYLFHIRGRETVLDALEHSLCGEDIVLIQDLTSTHEDGMHGERILRRALCDEARNDEDAARIASELVSLCNGIVLIHMPSTLLEYSVATEELFSAGAAVRPGELRLPNPTRPVALERAYRGTSALRLPSLIDDELGLLGHIAAQRTTPPAPLRLGTCLASDIVELSAQDEGVCLLVRLFGLEINWITVYRILETVETLMTEDGFPSPIKTSDRKALTNSANNFSISGLRSRHGFIGAGKPNNAPKATMNEAFETVRAATKEYFGFKLRQYRKS